MENKKYKFEKHINKEDLLIKVKELNDLGHNGSQIARIVNIPRSSLFYFLEIENIVIKNSNLDYNTNINFFDEINSEIKAYLLGYLIADGCISVEPKKKNGIIYSYNKRISFTVSEDDNYVLQLFKEYINPEALIRIRHDPKGAKVRKPSHMLRISSKYMIDVLINKYEIKPRKTWDADFKFNFSNIPKELHRHFIRGFFDGDGCIYRSKLAKTLNINFCFTSIYFMEQIMNMLKENIPGSVWNSSTTIGKTCTYYKACISLGYGKDKYLQNYFYKDSNFYLRRKSTKFNCADNTEINTQITQGCVSL